MLDRQKLEALLARRFPGSKYDQIAAAANAIMGLDDEWVEVPTSGPASPRVDAAIEFRVLQRRSS